MKKLKNYTLNELLEVCGANDYEDYPECKKSCPLGLLCGRNLQDISMSNECEDLIENLL